MKKSRGTCRSLLHHSSPLRIKSIDLADPVPTGLLQRTKSDPFLAMSVAAAETSAAERETAAASKTSTTTATKRRERLASHSFESILSAVDGDAGDNSSFPLSTSSDDKKQTGTLGSAGVKRPSMIQRQRPVARSKKGAIKYLENTVKFLLMQAMFFNNRYLFVSTFRLFV